MKLVLSSKYFEKRFLVVFSAIFLVWCFYYLFENEYIKYLAFFVTLFGFFEFVEIIFSFQNKKEIEIKDGWIKFPYSCEEYKLNNVNMEIRDFKGLRKVKFFIDEKEIFEWLFTDDELEKFREYLKPYLKNKKIDLTQEIEIFDNGFSVFGRFFGFDEVKKVDLNYIPSRTGGYMEFRIDLKDKSFLYRIDNNYKKAMILKLKINKDDCKKSEVNPVMLLLSIMALVFVISNEFRIIGIIIGLFVTMYWHDKMRKNYLYKLCIKVKKNNKKS